MEHRLTFDASQIEAILADPNQYFAQARRRARLRAVEDVRTDLEKRRAERYRRPSRSRSDDS